MSRFKQILVATDFSPHAQQALELASELASAVGATLRLVHVVHVNLGVGYPGYLVPGTQPDPTQHIRAAAEKRLRDVAKTIDQSGLEIEIEVREGSPAETICATAKDRGADLIVMGSQGHTGLAHILLGSVVERTLRLAPCPVLTTGASPAA